MYNSERVDLFPPLFNEWLKVSWENFYVVISTILVCKSNLISPSSFSHTLLKREFVRKWWSSESCLLSGESNFYLLFSSTGWLMDSDCWCWVAGSGESYWGAGVCILRRRAIKSQNGASATLVCVALFCFKGFILPIRGRDGSSVSVFLISPCLALQLNFAFSEIEFPIRRCEVRVISRSWIY